MKCGHEINFQDGYCERCFTLIQTKKKEKSQQPGQAIFTDLRNKVEPSMRDNTEHP